MKQTIVLLGTTLLLLLSPAVTNAGTCSGGKNCKACKNCRYCKHCSKQGGTCSVCNPKPKIAKK